MRHRTLRILMVRPVAHPPGGQVCSFLRPEGCGVYGQRPATCRHFPFGLVATPAGLRVTTEHRCPCRSLGPRPPLDPAVARASLVDAAGRLRPELTIGPRIHTHGRARVGFARYVDEIEKPRLASLLAGDLLTDISPFPKLDGATWADVAHLLRGYVDGSTGGEVAGFFGDVLLSMQGTVTRAKRARPWAWAFDRAAARGGPPETPQRVLGDWAADVLWSLAWTEHGPLDLALVDLATRLAVADEITGRLVASFDLRPDRAAAEAVMMAEVAGALPLWPSVLASILR